MKYLKTIMITFILLAYALSGGVYAEETQTGEAAAEEQTTTDDKSSDGKEKTEEEPECD
jgi:hypothetical protein